MPRTSIRLFSAAVWWRRPPAAFCVQVSWTCISLRRPGQLRRAGAEPAGKTAQKSQVSKLVARGAVELQQPGRKGSGEQLDYTAQDGKFVLTGTSAAPPRLTDQVRGTVTGNALIFDDRDDSVMVSGGPSKAVTQTRVAK